MDLRYKQVYEWGAGCLDSAGIHDAKLDARLMLEYVCQTDRNTLLVHGEREISQEEYLSYVNCISRREKHVPLQYITGIQEFMGLEFEVNEDVLIPRQDTEILVEEVMRHLHDGMRILDMCTGSGCILLSLLYYSNDCTGLGVDISEAAIRTAARNMEKLKAVKTDINAGFLQSDLFAAFESAGVKEIGAQGTERQEAGVQKTELQDTVHRVTGLQKSEFQGIGFGENRLNLSEKYKFDIIVSNPPYIKSSVIETLMPEVRDYEPVSALDGREDGLYFYREITRQARAYLSGGGELFFEIGYDQGAAVKDIMEAEGYKHVETVKDYAGLDRVVHGVLVSR